MISNTGILEGVKKVAGRFRQIIIDGQGPGAPLSMRIVGATTSGAPTTGSWKAGDLATDRAGSVWVCTVAGTPGTWVSGSGGGVSSVTAADTSIVIGGSGASPTVRTNTLDVVATQHPAAANWSNNSHKITSLTNGAASSDAAAWGQTVSGILTTAGDICIENATPAPARLAIGTLSGVSGNFLGVSGGLPAWTYPSGQFLCAPNSYAPASRTALTATTTTMAAWSTGNVCTNSFTAPASGNVLVTFWGMIGSSVNGDSVGLCLAAKGTITPVIGNVVTIGAPSFSGPTCVTFYVTGLTPGTSYQFDLLGCATSTTTATLEVQGQTSTALASQGAPAIMTVQAV